MKTLKITELKKELLVVELPEYYIANAYLDKISICNEVNNPIHFIEGSYTILGKVDEIKEEDVLDLVEQIGKGQVVKMGGWKNYKYKDLWCKTTLASFNSLLEKHFFWVFPYKIDWD